MKERQKIIKHKGDPLIKRQPYLIEHWHWITLLLVAYDITASNGAYFFALWLKFDCAFSAIETQYLAVWQKFVIENSKREKSRREILFLLWSAVTVVWISEWALR